MLFRTQKVKRYLYGHKRGAILPVLLLLLLVLQAGCGGGGRDGGGNKTPTHGTVTGAVKNALTDAPIADARVSIGGRSTYTGTNGEYEITGIPAGNYTITASAEGYKPYSQKINVQKGNQVIDIMMEQGTADYLVISYDEYYDKVHGGFAGQLIGNLFGLPYEGHWISSPGPSDITFYQSIPAGGYTDDDTFIEMIALLNLEENGIGATAEDYAEKWVEHIQWGVACANRAALENFKMGIMPPNSGMPTYNPYYLYIDAQIESDIYGLIAPGMPEAAQELAMRFGSLTNQSDGLLGATYIATLYSLAFFENDTESLVEHALVSLPAGSRYREINQYVLDRYKNGVKSWRTVRNEIYNLYYTPKEYGVGWTTKGGWVQADINGAMVTLALLFGEGDFAKTIQIAVQAGFDNDCNAATAGGILGTMLGYSALPDLWKSPLNNIYRNNGQLKNYPSLPLGGSLKITDIASRMAALGEEVILANGGEVVGTGEKIYNIADQPVPVVPYTSPISDADVFMGIANAWNERQRQKGSDRSENWEIHNSAVDWEIGLRVSFHGRPDVLGIHPKSMQEPAELRRTVDIPAQGAVLRIGVASHRIGDGADKKGEYSNWRLRIKVEDGGTEHSLEPGRIIRSESDSNRWVDLEYSLDQWKGKRVTIKMLNEANDWAWEISYWSHAEVVPR